MSRFYYFSCEHPLYGPAQFPYHSSSFTRTFSEITADKVDEFLRRWSESHAAVDDSEVIISIDNSNRTLDQVLTFIGK